MTYRTRLVARIRSTAKQLFPVFPRLRRYVAAINNAINDKLPLRNHVTKSQLNDRKSPITNEQFFTAASSALEMYGIRKIMTIRDSLSRKTCAFK